jgi:hypothetical protein
VAETPPCPGKSEKYSEGGWGMGMDIAWCPLPRGMALECDEDEYELCIESREWRFGFGGEPPRVERKKEDVEDEDADEGGFLRSLSLSLSVRRWSRLEEENGIVRSS